MKNFFLLLFSILAIAGSAQRDTTITFVNTAKIPVDIVKVHDTIIKQVHVHDTIYVQVPAKEKMYWSIAWNKLQTFEQFLLYAQKANATTVVDMDIVLEKSITIYGDIEVDGTGKIITSLVDAPLFYLDSGKHVFKNFYGNMKAANAYFFQTVVRKNILWTNYLENLTITGGRMTYSSSLGGIYDAASDKVVAWSNTYIKNCTFSNSWVNVSIYSQDGPCKALIIDGLWVSADQAHNFYTHPNVSIDASNITSTKVGPAKVCWHDFSGGDGVDGKGVISNAQYRQFKNCKSVQSGGMWQIAQPYLGAVYMNDCDIALYSTPLPFTIAYNNHYFNGGGGSFAKGMFVNCSGVLWPTDGTIIEGGNYDEISLKAGGVTTTTGAKINFVWADKAAAYTATFAGCQISNLNLLSVGTVKLESTSITKTRTVTGVIIK